MYHTLQRLPSCSAQLHQAPCNDRDQEPNSDLYVGIGSKFLVWGGEGLKINCCHTP